MLKLKLNSYTTEISCSSLEPPTNGEIFYNSEREINFEVGTIATYMCAAGYALIGSDSRTCMDDDHQDAVAVWNGNAPTCEGNNKSYNHYGVGKIQVSHFQVTLLQYYLARDVGFLIVRNHIQMYFVGLELSSVQNLMLI